MCLLKTPKQGLSVLNEAKLSKSFYLYKSDAVQHLHLLHIELFWNAEILKTVFNGMVLKSSLKQ